MQLLCSTHWARLAVKPLSVEAVELHMYQQHLNHLGHWVGFTGEHVHLNPKVKWAWCTVVLSQAREEKGRWEMYRQWAGKNCQCLWTCQVAQYICSSTLKVSAYLPGLSCRAACDDFTHAFLMTNQLASLYEKTKKKKRVQVMSLFKWMT